MNFTQLLCAVKHAVRCFSSKIMDGNNFDAFKKPQRPYDKEIFVRRKARGDWLDIHWKL